MIPLKLSLQNFLSYGSKTQTIDFTGYKLICLSGKNGHGKSALLDAMTWALWSQARKISNTTKADQGIVRQGQTDVMVIFDFMFNGTTYRIRRVFSTKYGKPHAHVDFGTYDVENDYFNSLTEKTARKTQALIDTTIGLSYESFINSCFLRQGQSNEFSKKSPKERKEVLATILGINKYEKARALAFEKARSMNQEKEHLQKMSERLMHECLQKSTIEQEQLVVHTTLTTLEQQEQAYRTQKVTLDMHQKELSEKQQEYAMLKLDLQKKSTDLQKNESTFFSLVRAWKLFHKHSLLLKDKKSIEQKKNELMLALHEQQQQMQKSLVAREQLLKLKEQEQDYLQNFKKKHSDAIQDKKMATERLKTIYTAQELQDKELTQEIVDYKAQAKTINDQISALQKTIEPTLLICDTAELQKRFDKHKRFYQSWIEQGNWVTKELKEIHEKERLSQNIENPSCPLCEQNLSLARKRFLQVKFSEKKQFYSHRLERLKRLMHWLKELLVQQHHALETNKQIDLLLQKHQQTNTSLTEKETAHAILIKEIAKIQTSLKTHEEEILLAEQHIITLIAQDEQFKIIQEERIITEKNARALTLSPTNGPSLQEQITHIDEQLIAYATLEQERMVQEQRRMQIHELVIVLKKYKHEERELTQKLKEYDTLTHKAKTLADQENTLFSQQKLLLQEKEILLQKKGAFENALQKIAQQEKESAHIALQIKELEITYMHYQAVAQAFSKDGIQALLIEEALPEIEQEANDLLSRLTDNHTHIFIESLRDLKKGGTRETLDINISDSNGIRAYELFSGGEAFRIDFALRIAISKLLARRAGTSLQTLIIDEGFGSQDEEGLSRIMDVIYKIQDDFEKIIIVSHLTSMKDQFPVHFVVEKGPQGSQLHIKELA